MTISMRLNSVNYVLVPDGNGNHIREERIEPLATTVKQEGIQRPNFVLPHNKLILPPPTHGIGLPKILARDIDNPHKLARSKISELDTRFIPTTLPRQAEGLTEPTNSGDTIYTPRVWTYYNNLLYVMFDGAITSSGQPGIHNVSYSAGSWTHHGKTGFTGGGMPGTGDARIPLSVVQDGNQWILLQATVDDQRIWRSTDLSGAWNQITTNPTGSQLVNNVTKGEDIDAGKLVNVPGYGTIAVLWDEDNKVVDVFKSTDQGDTWSSDKTNATTAINGIHGAALYYDLNGDVAPVFVTDDAIWAYDTSATAVHLLAAIPASANNGKAIAVWANPFLEGRQVLYVGLGDGRVLEYLWIGTSTAPRIRILFMNYHGALDADMEGRFIRFLPTSQWLYGSLSGHDGDGKAWIAAYDGRASAQSADTFDPSEGWHFMTQHGTANREIDFLAIDPDGDLVFSMRTGTTTSDTQYIQNAQSPPNSGDTINYESSGVLDRPRVDGGFPHDSGAWLAVAYEADDLSASNSGEYINLDRGVNAATPSTDVGDILSGTRALALVSGAGIEGREFQLRENYHRAGTTTNTPKGHDVEIMYRKKINKLTAGNDNSDSLRRFTVTVDIDASVSANESVTREDVLNGLFDAEGNQPLQTLEVATIGISSAKRYVDVKVLAMSHNLDMMSPEYLNQASAVKLVTLSMEEVV